MRTDLIFTFANTADVYDAETSFDEDTGDTVVNYVFNRNSPCSAVQGPNGLYLTARQKVERYSQIRNLLDPDGISMLASEWVFVTDVFPQLDWTGRVVGWKHRLSPELPRDFKKEIQALVAQA